MRARTYSAVDVAKLTDLSYRQVDYWLRCGVLATADGNDCPGSGAQRRFDERELQVAAIACRLGELGCRLPTLKVVCARLRELDDFASFGLLFVRSDGSLETRPDGSGWIVDLAEFQFDTADA